MNVLRKLLSALLCFGLLGGAAQMEAAMGLKKSALVSLGSLAVGIAGSLALHFYHEKYLEKEIKDEREELTDIRRRRIRFFYREIARKNREYREARQEIDRLQGERDRAYTNGDSVAELGEAMRRLGTDLFASRLEEQSLRDELARITRVNSPSYSPEYRKKKKELDKLERRRRFVIPAKTSLPLLGGVFGFFAALRQPSRYGWLHPRYKEDVSNNILWGVGALVGGAVGSFGVLVCEDVRIRKQ